MIAFVLRTSV
jgi:hypothetical protein